MTLSSPTPPSLAPAPPPLRGASPPARFAAELLGYALDLSAADILAPRRGQAAAAAARQVAMYLLATAHEMSLTQVAASIGRDRSTVAHGLRVVEDRREDPRFDSWLQHLEDAVRLAAAARPSRAEPGRNGAGR
ncbi:MAG: helix-turn-helix domain-containing protein [Hyphomonadaceae bacterium]|nr:helix-turn-helix domain-containing protein [Hyphomonadaceae bacterium]